MLLLLATAHAALPWECPTLEAPPDAPQFRTDAGLADTFSALDALAEAWVEPDCAWTDTTLDTGAIESTCTTSTGAIVTVTNTEGTATGEMFPSDYRDWSSWTVVVELPEGMDRWTRLALGFERSYSTSGTASSAGTTSTAAWTGAVLDLPDDSSFTLSDSSSCSFGMCDDRTTIDTPACDWSWGAGDAIQSQWVRSGGHEAIIYGYWQQCGVYPTQAYFDDALYGSIVLRTWALAEVDRDGWSVLDGDCDDADPTVYPCAPEIAGDGIDQDCDGADSLEDGDGDGDPDPTDCDDADGSVHVGADDPAGDGVDQDCDGAEDIDADADHYTADGDNLPADCDDGDATVHPGRAEIECDGVDQDCDGADACAEDSAEPEDTGAPPSAEPPAEPGCGGRGAWLVLGGMALLRPRR